MLSTCGRSQPRAAVPHKGEHSRGRLCHMKSAGLEACTTIKLQYGESLVIPPHPCPLPEGEGEMQGGHGGPPLQNCNRGQPLDVQRFEELIYVAVAVGEF